MSEEEWVEKEPADLLRGNCLPGNSNLKVCQKCPEFGTNKRNALYCKVHLMKKIGRMKFSLKDDCPYYLEQTVVYVGVEDETEEEKKV